MDVEQDDSRYAIVLSGSSAAAVVELRMLEVLPYATSKPPGPGKPLAIALAYTTVADVDGSVRDRRRDHRGGHRRRPVRLLSP